MMIAALVLAAVTVTYSPARPAVGDLITIEFPERVRLNPSADYEIVAQQGSRAVIRTFEPKPFIVSGQIGNAAFRDLKIPVRSVLEPKDDLNPAPLAPPRSVPYERKPFIAIGVAALLAVAAWAAVWLRSRRPTVVIEPALPAGERFRRAVVALREAPSKPMRWAALADETRAFLAVTRPHFGSDLTTTEILPRLRDDEQIIAEILRQGDLEKFSGRGAAPRDFDEIAARALDLAAPREEAKAA